MDEYSKHGAEMELVSDNTAEGQQFCKGFEGIGAMLGWKVCDDFDGQEDNQDDGVDFSEYL